MIGKDALSPDSKIRNFFLTVFFELPEVMLWKEMRVDEALLLRMSVDLFDDTNISNAGREPDRVQDGSLSSIS